VNRHPVTPELAIANNHAWYASMFRAHGLANRLEEHYWSTDAQPPPYYSNLVTRTRGAAAREAQLRRLAALAAPDRTWGCKDSFDELPGDELGNLGLRPLFRAVWYGWAAGAGAPESGARRVDTPEALAAWEAHWRRSSPAGAARVFPDPLLVDADVELFAMGHEGGFALNRSAGAIGLSNVFHRDDVDAGAFVCACARVARHLHPDLPVVGYGPERELASLAPLGFVALGPLSVWVAGMTDATSP